MIRPHTPRLSRGIGMRIAPNVMCLVTTGAPHRLDLDEGEIAATMDASETIDGRPAVWVWLSSGVGFLWAKENTK